MKTTEKEFNLFQQECEKWIEKFGLKGWDVTYQLDKLDGALAECAFQLKDHIATICFTTDYEEPAITGKEIAETALHEVLHLALARLSDLGISRFVSEKELIEAEEEVVRILIKNIRR